MEESNQQDSEHRRGGDPRGRAQQAPLTAQRSRQPDGLVIHRIAWRAFHARHAAFSTIQLHSRGKPIPRWAACSGSNEARRQARSAYRSPAAPIGQVRPRCHLVPEIVVVAPRQPNTTRRDRDIHRPGGRIGMKPPG